MTDELAPKLEQQFEGVAASPGIAMGPVFFIGADVVTVEKKTLTPQDVDQEVVKFAHALESAKSDLQQLVEKTSLSIGIDSAKIFEIHQLLLEDVMIVDETVRRIREEHMNADQAFLEVMEHFEVSMESIEGEYLKARAADIRDVKRRVIRKIQGDVRPNLKKLKDPAIIFAKELTPSDTVNLERNKVLGFAMDFGGRTSHAAIMARSIKVPSVVGLKKTGNLLHTGDFVILDGNSGILIINPNPETITQYKKRFSDFRNIQRKLEHLKNLPTRTLDGKNIELSANIEFPEEAKSVREYGGFGVGLFRTEYLYLTKDELPSEEMQFKEYVRILQALGDQPAIIRTFDLGGDKVPHTITLPPEANPFLGARGIRLYRDGGADLFKTQLRAIVRASVHGKVRIMFPMISCVTEIRYCQSMLNEVKQELLQEGIAFSDNIPVGAMIEVPSAAMVADMIARECDFLSIGTNDLVQYTLAVDRGNEHIAYLYRPYNPAVLRLIKNTIDKGHKNGVWVGICGEMASDPLMTMIFIGMGMDEFSVSPVSLLIMKEIIRRVECNECIMLADQITGFSTPGEIEGFLRELMKTRFQDLSLLF
ncbi:MAG TPA: phosphoenolpyruvate--protein phosphotransferase [bacterium]|nr:phosphoenolpyruvate--protein phosphotransferase [bacterium]HPN45841.1 phosphoenolpyruvate--protein phosphotransferase [bacterium]